MKLILKIFFLFGLLLSPTRLWAMEDTIVAIVNSDIVTLRDLHQYLNEKYWQLKTEGKSEKEIQAGMAELQSDGVNKLIDDKLVLSAATEKKIDVPEGLIDKRLTEIKSKYKSEDEFLQGLLTEGATITDLRDRIRDQLRMKFLIEQEVGAKIYVNPQEVTEYYKNHFDQFKKPERLELDSIYVRKGRAPGTADATKEKITQAFDQIKGGQNFLEVAKKFSNTPSIGIIEKGKMLSSIEDAVFKLKEGDISDIIEVPEGFYIFKVNKKLPAEIASLEEMKHQISDDIFYDKYRVRLRKWIDKLRESAFIEIKDNL